MWDGCEFEVIWIDWEILCSSDKSKLPRKILFTMCEKLKVCDFSKIVVESYFTTCTYIFSSTSILISVIFTSVLTEFSFFVAKHIYSSGIVHICFNYFLSL